MSEKVIMKMGITPSNAPFRISNLRTFIYIYCILLHKYKLGYDCKLIFQIDNTNPNKNLHSDNEIIDFYKKLEIISNIIPTEITHQQSYQELSEYYYNILFKKGYIIISKNGVSYFDLNKYAFENGKLITINDRVFKEISVNILNLSENGMIAIRRSDGTFLYHFASCIDIHNQNLTHIVRGQNKLLSSVLQAIMCQVLSFKLPEFIHLPLLLEHDKNQRKTIFNLLDEGYDIGPIISYLISSGYGDSSILYHSYDELAKNLYFPLFHTKNANFDINILKKHSNRYYKEISYFDYQKSIYMTSQFFGDNVLEKLLSIFYKHGINYQKIKDYLEMFDSMYKEELTEEEKGFVIKIIPLLLKNLEIDEIFSVLNQIPRRKIYEMIQWIFTGKRVGTSANLLMEIYDKDTEFRQEFIKKMRSII